MKIIGDYHWDSKLLHQVLTDQAKNQNGITHTITDGWSLRALVRRLLGTCVWCGKN
jgi:hypothetical protein